MKSAPPPMPVDRFRELLVRRFGLQLDDGKREFLTELLRSRLEETRSKEEAYLERLAVAAWAEEMTALARRLTVTETYFFRNADQFRALAEVAIPERSRARAACRRLRLLSAGCSSGEEVYSLAIALRELGVEAPWDVEVLGLDVNPAMLEKAARAHYSSWSLRETPPALRERWFRLERGEIVVDERARAFTRFEACNLVTDDPARWLPASYDVVFCRNVLMYFTPEAARATVDRITQALAPGGYLFLGHAETLRGLSSDYHLCHTHGAFYYRRRERLGERPLLPDVPAPGRHPSVPLPPAAMVTSAPGSACESWIESIGRATARVDELAARRPGTSPDPGPSVDGGRSPLVRACELLQDDRPSEALRLVEATAGEGVRGADEMLLQAALLVHAGRFAEAERSCRALLAQDELNAGARHVLALCREGAGDLPGAREHDEAAAYLDPDFAMPRLHLGMLARRNGERETARRRFADALFLLQREDPARILFFGGGFSREALLELCRAELQGCGGAP